MDQNKNFRSAFNGFNRDDVVRYLEYMTNKHGNVVNQLTGELEFVRKQLETAVREGEESFRAKCAELEKAVEDALAEAARQTERAEDAQSQTDSVQQQLAAAQSKNAELEARIAQLEAAVQAQTAEKDAAVENCAVLRSQLEAAQARCAAFESKAVEELEAYRRAERAERQASEKAATIYHHTNGILGEATVLVDDASRQINCVASQILEQLNQLQSAVSTSRDAMQKASDVLYQLRPEQEA